MRMRFPSSNHSSSSGSDEVLEGLGIGSGLRGEAGSGETGLLGFMVGVAG